MTVTQTARLNYIYRLFCTYLYFIRLSTDLLPIRAGLSIKDCLPVRDELSIKDCLLIRAGLSIKDCLPVRGGLSIRAGLSIKDCLLVRDSLSIVDCLPIRGGLSIKDCLPVSAGPSIRPPVNHQRLPPVNQTHLTMQWVDMMNSGWPVLWFVNRLLFVCTNT